MVDRPAAARERRERGRLRFDPRLAIGVGLVLASVAGVYAVVASADRTVEVYSASVVFNPGDRIRASDLHREHVRLGELRGRYLTPERLPGKGVIATRTVLAGELVPASAVGSVAGDRFSSVVVTVGGQLARSVEPGVVVDVWSAAETEHGDFGPPAVLVGSATVVRVVESTGIIADGGTVSVEILVPRVKIARVLEAVANGDALSLVPVGLPIER